MVEQTDKVQALTLLWRKLEIHDDDQAVSEVAIIPEYTPLATVQAAAYISHRVPRYSVRQHLEEFKKGDHKKTNLLNYGRR